MRVFIASDLPEDIKEELKEIRISEDIAKIIYPTERHLTLRFLGEIGNKKVEIVRKNLRKVRVKGFNLKLDKIGFFPNKEYMRVVWVGLTPKRKVIELKQKIDDAIMDLFPREKRFEPHVTLGRIKSIKDKEKFRKFFDLDLEGGFNVKSFKLIKSELTKEGAKYEVLEEYS